MAAEKEDFAELIEHCTVFAKVTPQQKMSIVAGLQSKGHIVGFLGDGNNDALALRKADVGVSVDSGKLHLHACKARFAQTLQCDAHFHLCSSPGICIEWCWLFPHSDICLGKTLGLQIYSMKLDQ